MTLKAQLQDDLTTAMKARDTVRLATIRMALTAVTNEEVAGKQSRELTDDDVLKVLARELKKRKEAATAFSEAGKDDRAQAELAEAAVLEEYLPAQLSDDELVALVTAAVAESGATNPQGMGAVMKIVQPKIAGRADGSRVAAEVKRQLAT
ncbi:MAG TPA: GatB/YqeY domain-containing protein [Actinomycetes bacterium]|nr:GatB/YqeY domain-containing protein [Actinomycetes bacterium]